MPRARHPALEQLDAQGAMISALASDSRRCAPGVAFLAYPGEASDGRRYIAEAIASGAAAVIWDRDGFAWRDTWGVPNTGVPRLKHQAGFIADAFYGSPSQALWVCGVTGTNGKTTCTQWLAAALGASGDATGLIGTLGSGFPGALEPLPNTTPDALEIQRLLAALRDDGARAVALEVSSHGLEQGRLNGIAFDCALFTNLSHDHLDYHGTMQSYALAKRRLFETPGLGAAVINLDDLRGVEFAGFTRARGIRTIGYSLHAEAPPATEETIVAQSIDADDAGQRIAVRTPWGSGTLRLAYFGRFNAANALGVLGCLLVRGIGFGGALKRLEALPGVPGRLERLGGDGEPLVVVDFAHTPDALAQALQALRPVAAARGGTLVVVFGAGGDRDPAKRPLMGHAAAQGADRIVVTSDNPRGEDPLAIIKAIGAGIPRDYEAQQDRARAIRAAILAAQPGDVVLIAGKGHERSQEIRGEKIPFVDQDEARAALRARAAHGEGVGR